MSGGAELPSVMQRLGNWASKSVWRTVLVGPFLLVYIIWKIPSALKEWGDS